MKRFVLFLFLLAAPAWPQASSEYFKTVNLCAGVGCGSGPCVYQLGDVDPQLSICSATGRILDFTGGILVITSDGAAIVFEPETAGDSVFRLGLVVDGGADDDDSLRIGKGPSAGTPLVTFAESGRVGIGTTVPDSLLHISAGSFGQVDPVLTLSNPAGAGGVGIDFVGTGNQPTHARIYNIDVGDFASRLTMQTKSTGIAGPLVDRLTINQAGFVGIGTTAPSHALHILNSGFAGMKLEKTSATNPFLIYNSAGTQLSFFDLGVGLDRMVIDADGDVGIGTTAPSTILDVDAGTGIGTITIDGDGGGCHAIRDTDNLGWTCSTTLNGLRTDFCCLSPSACANDC